MKRAANKNGANKPANKKAKIESLNTNNNRKTQDENEFIDFKNGEAAFKSFLGDDITLNDFLENYWEKKPLIIRRNSNQQWIKYIQSLFTLDHLKTIINEQNPQYELDINLCKLVNGKKKVFNKKSTAKLDHVMNAFEKDKVTIQFHQPQRFSDGLWKLLEKFECFFKCLVGSNIYITPSDSQGLASHYDDIEAFVIQLEGSKHWLLYDPIYELPNTYSNDLDAKSLKKPIHDIVLQTGDILYFPRGVIHQANTPANEKNSYSTHVTISTYQNFNNMEFATSVIENSLQRAFKTNIELRRGLPIGFFQQNNFGELLKSIIQKVNFDDKSCAPKELLEDFVSNRLPPYKNTNNANDTPASYLSTIQKNDKNMKIKLKHPEHVYVILASGNDETYDENDEDEEESETVESDQEYTYIYHSVSNLKSLHMMTKEDNHPNCIKVGAECYEALQSLIKNGNENWITVVDLNNNLKQKLSQTALNDLLISLAVENLIEIKV